MICATWIASNAWYPRLTAAMNFVGIGGPHEGLGVVIGFLKEAVDGGLEINDRSEHPAFEAAPGHGVTPIRPVEVVNYRTGEPLVVDDRAWLQFLGTGGSAHRPSNRGGWMEHGHHALFDLKLPFLSQVPVKRSCIILPSVPKTETKIGNAKAVATALGTNFVAPEILEGLETDDGTHLTQPSAQRWVPSFF